MPIRFIFIFAVIFPIFSGADPLTLKDAYQLSLEQSEQLKISEETVKLADAQYREALAAVFPQISLTSTERLRNEGSSNSESNSGSGFSGGGFSGSRTDRFLFGATLSQPIFHGFQDFLLFYAAKAETRGKQNESARFREILYGQVSEAFYQTLLYQRQLIELAQAKKAVIDRIAELKEFEKIGKSRASEISASEVSLYQTISLEQELTGALAASKEALAFFTGKNSSELAAAEEPLPVEPLQLEQYIEKSRARLDILAAREVITSSEHQLKAAGRERWPGIDLESNYYGYENPDNGREWDVLFRLQVPIFEGGRISAKVGQQQALLRSNVLKEQEARRKAEQEVRTAYAKLVSSRQQVSALEKSVSSSNKSYLAQKEDYKLGIVNNLDVLNSIRQLYDSRRELASAQTAVNLNQAILEVAAGGIS